MESHVANSQLLYICTCTSNQHTIVYNYTVYRYMLYMFMCMYMYTHARLHVHVHVNVHVRNVVLPECFIIVIISRGDTGHHQGLGVPPERGLKEASQLRITVWDVL